MKEKGVKGTPSRISVDASQRKYDTVGRKRRIEPFKSVPQSQAQNFVLEALKEFEVQFEDDSEDEYNRQMFGTLMKCPESDQEAFDMARKMEEDASRWGQCDDDSEELECSDDE